MSGITDEGAGFNYVEAFKNSSVNELQSLISERKSKQQFLKAASEIFESIKQDFSSTRNNVSKKEYLELAKKFVEVFPEETKSIDNINRVSREVFGLTEAFQERDDLYSAFYDEITKDPRWRPDVKPEEVEQYFDDNLDEDEIIRPGSQGKQFVTLSYYSESLEEVKDIQFEITNEGIRYANDPSIVGQNIDQCRYNKNAKNIRNNVRKILKKLKNKLVSEKEQAYQQFKVPQGLSHITDKYCRDKYSAFTNLQINLNGIESNLQKKMEKLEWKLERELERQHEWELRIISNFNNDAEDFNNRLKADYHAFNEEFKNLIKEVKKTKCQVILDYWKFFGKMGDVVKSTLMDKLKLKSDA